MLFRMTKIHKKYRCTVMYTWLCFISFMFYVLLGFLVMYHNATKWFRRYHWTNKSTLHWANTISVRLKKIACKYKNVKSFTKNKKQYNYIASIIKHVRNMFRLKRGNKSIKNRVIRDIRTPFELEKENFFKPVGNGKSISNN